MLFSWTTRLSAVALLLANAAQAESKFETGYALGAGLTTWRTDLVPIQTSIHLGFRPHPNVSFNTVGRLSYATVDERLVTHISIGVTGYLPFRSVEPYLRIAAIHQHEESVAVVADVPFKAILGIGEAIRHRAGLGTSLGANFGFEGKRWSMGPELEARIFFERSLGPELFVAMSLWGRYDFTFQ